MFPRTRLLQLALAMGFLAAVLIPFGLFAQEITGNISGTVVDATGGVIPEATVGVVNLATGAARTTTTTSAGVFFFTRLPIGDYTLSVEKQDFKKYEASGIHLDVNDKLDFRVALQVGQRTESVTVTAESPPLQTETGEVSNLIGAAQTQAIPLNGRVFNSLIELVPGITPENGRIGSGVALDNDTNVAINGNQSNSNLWLLDGQNNMDIGSNAQNVVTPPLESLEEVKVLRNNFSAEFGQVTGGVVNAVTKSGSKDFHGSLYEFLRNDKLDAADFFLNASNGQKSKLRLNDFGFSVGGPFWIPGRYNMDRSKDFFFFTSEFRRQTRGGVATDNVPTTRQRQGILDPECAVTPAPCTPQAFDPQEVTITDEANVDPALIDPNATALISRYPQPNASYADLGFNWIGSANVGLRDHTEMARWDHYIGEKANLMVRYMQEAPRWDGINAQFWGDDNFPSVNSDWTYSSKNAVIKLTATLTPRLVNDFQVGYTNNNIRYVTGKTSDPELTSRAGFTYTELFPQTNGSFPTMWGVENFGALLHQAPFFNREDLFEWKDNLAYAFGKHNLKMGFFAAKSRKREPANGGGDDTAGTLDSINSYRDLLQGNIAVYAEEQTLNEVADRWRDVSFYVQDTWKALPNLTFDYGLRWQFMGQVFAAHNNIANFWPSRYDPSGCSPAAFNENGLVDPTLCDTLNGIVTPNSPNVGNRALVQNHFKDWEPRFGLAWSPRASKKLVIRGGGGIYHGRDAISQTSALGQPPPNDRTAVLNGITFADLAPGGLSPFNPDLPQPPLLLQVLDPVYFNPQSYQYSLGFQYEPVQDTTLEINYVGSHQIHQGRNRDINQIAPQYQRAVYDGTLNPDLVRPYLGFSHIYVNERAGVSRYNSLQVYINRRMRQGFQFQASYTYSHSISNTINRDSEGRSSPVQDAFHPELDRSWSPQDQPHALVFNYIWQIPFFKNAPGWKKAMLGGWELTGITSFRSGLPTDVCIDHAVDGTLGEHCERPNLIAPANLPKGQRTLSHYFNTDAFVLQDPGTFGNAARNLIRGPGINCWDFSIFKNFDIPWFGRRSGWAAGESATLQFRGEFFNGWNHTQFSGLDTTFIPLADQAGSSVDPGSSFGTITGARTPREIQFGLRLIF
ncbi:MAG: carboxypeptidase regulatory-like domain-containing protein [Acidobacteriia bacterium]|nr:carboxypeptidase regulatory-like domain-containing protein [Terriglobia bacterium]